MRNVPHAVLRQTDTQAHTGNFYGLSKDAHSSETNLTSSAYFSNNLVEIQWAQENTDFSTKQPESLAWYCLSAHAPLWETLNYLLTKCRRERGRVLFLFVYATSSQRLFLGNKLERRKF